MLAADVFMLKSTYEPSKADHHSIGSGLKGATL